MFGFKNGLLPGASVNRRQQSCVTAKLAGDIPATLLVVLLAAVIMGWKRIPKKWEALAGNEITHLLSIRIVEPME